MNFTEMTQRGLSLTGRIVAGIIKNRLVKKKRSYKHFVITAGTGNCWIGI